MTITQRKRPQPEEIQAVTEPGVQIECDGCACDLTHSVRIKCADPVCEPGDGVDICPACFCAGKEFRVHKRTHAYRVIELHSYPIFDKDWGADEELLLLEGISLQGMGNWQAVSEHVGTRTKDEVEKHYNEVYIKSPNWPMPRMDLHFDIDPDTFHARKRARISAMDTAPPPLPKVAPTSAPGVHEIGAYLPGRLEFEHELDQEAEDLVKDLEFGICLAWGGDEIPEDEADLDVRARARWIEDKRAEAAALATAPVIVREVAGKRGKKLPVPTMNGHSGSGSHNGTPTPLSTRPKSDEGEEGEEGEEGGEEEQPTQPPPIETESSLQFKLSILEMYDSRVQKRHEAKQLMFNRGLLEYKKMQTNEKKRGKEEKELLARLRPFAKLQTAEDFEAFVTDIMWESTLRRRIQDLQHHRRLGLRTAADIDKYDSDLQKRMQIKANVGRDYYGTLGRGPAGRGSSAPDARRSMASLEPEGSRGSREPDAGSTPSAGPARKPPAPLNLANSPALHLLTPAEQTLCAQLRILPTPYLVIKETLVREYARRGGKLRRREARDLVKIDVNKTSRVWDFLVQAGYLSLGTDVTANAVAAATGNAAGAAGAGAGGEGSSTAGPSNLAAPPMNWSPSKESQAASSPRPPAFVPAGLAGSGGSLPTLSNGPAR